MNMMISLADRSHQTLITHESLHDLSNYIRILIEIILQLILVIFFRFILVNFIVMFFFLFRQEQ